MRKALTTALIGLTAAGLWALPTLADDYRVTGKAYHADDADRLLYEERYTPIDGNDQAEVHYVSPEGEAIARKRLDYSRGQSKPSYTLIDERHDLIWSVQWEGDSHLALRQGDRDNPDTKRVSADEPQVVDAGFDGFITEHWDALLEGERLTFYFAFPNRLTNVRLRAERIARSDSQIVDGKDDWVYFRIQVNSRLLSLFADDLFLAYDRDNRQLQVFRGRSNLPDENGDGVDVQIRYDYP